MRACCGTAIQLLVGTTVPSENSKGDMTFRGIVTLRGIVSLGASIWEKRGAYGSQ